MGLCLKIDEVRPLGRLPGLCCWQCPGHKLPREAGREGGGGLAGWGAGDGAGLGTRSLGHVAMSSGANGKSPFPEVVPSGATGSQAGRGGPGRGGETDPRGGRTMGQKRGDEAPRGTGPGGSGLGAEARPAVQKSWAPHAAAPHAPLAPTHASLTSTLASAASPEALTATRTPGSRCALGGGLVQPPLDRQEHGVLERTAPGLQPAGWGRSPLGDPGAALPPRASAFLSELRGQGWAPRGLGG